MLSKYALCGAVAILSLLSASQAMASLDVENAARIDLAGDADGVALAVLET